jgi:enoyl-CoA hydratase
MLSATKGRSALSNKSYEEIQVDHNQLITTITLSRPAALNSITTTMLSELQHALDQTRTAGTRVIVLTGAGRAFSAGVDLKALNGAPLTGGMVGDALDIPARQLIRSIRESPAIVIAKVNGHCFTGALEIALACDLMICADEAVFGDTHAKWGLRPTWGMSQRLPAAVGLARARMLSYRSMTFTGQDAVRWGLAGESWPRSELDDTVERVSREIVANSPGSLAAYKDLFRFADDASILAGLDYEATTRYEIADTEERIAGFR